MIIEINKIKKYLGRVFVYLCLLTCGLMMTKSAIDNYLERKTSFEIEESPLTLKDLPVFTICYKIKKIWDTIRTIHHSHDYCHPQILNQSILFHGEIVGNGSKSKIFVAEIW